ncbi:MAG: hypothetical protein KJI69_05270 [Patescibacteria group bacterium]|nr:hypothetical protein [Patescibacteria group bacterium]
MKQYKVLLSKKEYALLIVNANSEKEAISKAYNDEFERVIHDPEKLPDSNYIIEKVVGDKKNKRKDIEDIEDEMAEIEADQHTDFRKNSDEGRKRMSELLLELNVLEAK